MGRDSCRATEGWGLALGAAGVVAVALPLLIAASVYVRSEGRPLRIGLNPWPGQAFLHLADELGYFADEGVEVRIVEYSSLSDVRRAFELGQLDLMGVSAVEFLQAEERCRRAPRVVAVTDFSVGADVILARSPAARVADLRGKRVALEVGSLNLFVLGRALDRAGMTFADVTLVPTNQSDVAAAVAAGAADAAVTYPPFADEVRRAAPVAQVFSTAEIPDELPSFLVADGRTASRDDRALAGVLRAWDRAVAYAAANRSDAYGRMARRLRMAEADFAAVLDGTVRVVPPAGRAAMLARGGVADTVVRGTAACLAAAARTVPGLSKGQNEIATAGGPAAEATTDGGRR